MLYEVITMDGTISELLAQNGMESTIKEHIAVLDRSYNFV